MTASGDNSRQPLTVLVVATEWESRHGGLSTFNRELCKAIAALGHRVLCLVPAALQDEINAAAAGGVHLVVADDPGLSDEMRLSAPRQLPNNAMPDVIIGHGRVTGAAATVLARYYQRSQRVHFIHVAPGAIEWFKDHPTQATERAEEREQLEVDLARSASLVAAVGPLLLREFSILLNAIRRDLHEFRPGLGELREPVDIPNGVQCLVLGRAEDETLKGLDIAARAFAHLDHSGNARPILMVRGAPKGGGDELRKRLIKVAGDPAVDIRVRTFSSRENRIAEDLAQSSVLLMPSRSEGFGLVGLEGIAAGVPVLLSDRSGLAEVLNELVPELAELHIVTVTDDLEIDGPVWARRLTRLIANRSTAFKKAAELRARLKTLLSWKESAARMLKALSEHSSNQRSGASEPKPGKVIALPVSERQLSRVGATAPVNDLKVADISTVRSWGWSDVRLQAEINQLDYETMDGLTTGHAGQVQQWAPVFSEHPESWRLLYASEGHIAGYWHFVPLFPEQYDQAKAGQLMDVSITADRVRAFELPGIYNVYFAGIALKAEFRRPRAMRMLLTSLLEVLASLASEDVFVGEICANAFTPGGAALCKSVGMRFCVKHVDHGEVYVGRMVDLLDLHFAQDFAELKALYRTNERRHLSA